MASEVVKFYLTEDYFVDLTSFLRTANLDSQITALNKYALKSQIPTVDQTYNSTSSNPQSGKAVAQAIAASTHLVIKKVTTLPSTGVANTIYLVPGAHTETQNVYTEYMWLDNAWEVIGSTAIDLTDYATKSYVTSSINTALNTYVTTAALTQTLNSYSTTTQMNTAIANAVNAAKTEINQNVTAVSNRLTTVENAYLKKSALTQSQFNALQNKDANTIYIITDVLG